MLAKYRVPSPIAVFECHCDSTVIGESVCVVGSVKELGEWKCCAATELITSAKEFPLWRSCIFHLQSVNPDDTVEFKFFIRSNPPRWETCLNRVFRCPQPGQLARISAKFGQDNHVTVSISETSAGGALEATTADDETTAVAGPMAPPVIGNPPIVVSSPPKVGGAVHPEEDGDDQYMLSQDFKSHSLVRYEWTGPTRIRLRTPEKMFPAVAVALVEGNRSAPSLRRKFILIRDIIAGATDTFISTTAVTSPVTAWRQSVHSRDLLTAFGLSSVYVNWVATGAIVCHEDGSHHRPNETALVAKEIVNICEKWRYDLHKLRQGQDHIWEVDILEFFTRRLQPYLPSFDKSFTSAVPLTRIRDIAHRNDICQDLKREIKTRLQNKLHRCAGPEDLRTSQELLNRFHAARHNYPHDFIIEFERFHAELRDFFNAGDLIERLQKLLDYSKHNPRRTNAINRFLANKYTVDSQLAQKSGLDATDSLLVLIRSTTQLRDSLYEEILRDGFDDKTSCPSTSSESGRSFFASDPAHGQSLRLADIQAETFLFTLLSQVVNEIELLTGKQNFTLRLDIHTQTRVLGTLLAVLREGLRNIAYSGFAVQSCGLLAREIRAALESSYASHSFFAMHLASMSRRVLRITQAFSDLLSVAMPPSVLERLGAELRVDPQAARIYTEGQIRASIVFQLARAASLSLRLCEIETLHQSPFTTLCEGDCTGTFQTVETLLDAESMDVPEGDVIFFVRQATGDEELDGLSERMSMRLLKQIRIVGVVIAHDLPALSHLGVRARQLRLPFLAVSSPTFDASAFESAFKGEFVKLNTEYASPICLCSRDSVPRCATTTAPIVRQSSTLLRPRAVDVFQVLSGQEIIRESCGTKAAACEHLSSTILASGGTLLGGSSAPRCLAIPFGSFEATLLWPENSSIASRIQQLISDVNVLSGSSLTSACEQLQTLIKKHIELNAQAASLLQKGLVEHFLTADVMSLKSKSASFIMARSSSNVEDLKGLSGAGLYDSVPAQLTWSSTGESDSLASNLNVAPVWAAIKAVWASLYTDRAVLARRAARLRGASMAVLLQPLIPATWSFIVHTRCPKGICSALAPDEQSDGWMYVELARGLGEALAGAGTALGGGRPTRLAVAVDVKKGAVYEALWDMQGRFKASGSGHLEQVYTALRPVETQRHFWEAIVEKLRPLKALETLFGSPQDVEGCLAAETPDELPQEALRVFVLQSRPQSGL